MLTKPTAAWIGKHSVGTRVFGSDVIRYNVSGTRWRERYKRDLPSCPGAALEGDVMLHTRGVEWRHSGAVDLKLLRRVAGGLTVIARSHFNTGKAARRASWGGSPRHFSRKSGSKDVA